MAIKSCASHTIWVYTILRENAPRVILGVIPGASTAGMAAAPAADAVTVRPVEVRGIGTTE
jgi:hypothetical protein